MADEEAVDIVTLIIVGAIAICIIFALVVVPSLASNQQLMQILYVIVAGIISILSVLVGKNTKRA